MPLCLWESFVKQRLQSALNYMSKQFLYQSLSGAPLEMIEWLAGWEITVTMNVFHLYVTHLCVCVCTSIILFWWLVISCAYDDSPEAKCRSLSAPISSAVCICWGSSALWVKSLFYCLFVLCLVFMCIWLNYSTSDNLASLLHGVLIVMIRVACYQS